MKQFDSRGQKINYDAPGQLGANSPKPQKLKRRDRLIEQLDAMVDYWNSLGQPVKPLHVTLDQLKKLEGVSLETRSWQPTGNEAYRDHPLLVADDE